MVSLKISSSCDGGDGVDADVVNGGAVDCCGSVDRKETAKGLTERSNVHETEGLDE